MSYVSEVLADSPILWYRQDDASGTVLTDSSGSARHATIVGTPTYGVTGAIPSDSANKAIDYNGSSAYAQAGSGSVADTALKAMGTSFTLEVWTRLASVTGQQAWVDRYASGAVGVSAYLFYLTGGKVRFLIRNSAEADQWVDSTTSPSATTWYHLVATYDGTTAKIYVNGTLENSVAITAASGFQTRSAILRLAQSAVGGANGRLDEVAIYNSALSASRISTHYQVGITPLYSDAVLADSPVWWGRLAEKTGTVMANSSGAAGRDGIYGGSPTLGVAGLIGGSSNTAVQFNGTNSYGRVTYASWMDSPTALTVEAWIKTTMIGSGAIVDRDPLSQRVWQFRINAGEIEFVKIGGTGGTVTASTPLATYNDGNIHHVVATYDGTDIKLYVDGALVQTTSAAGTLGTATGWLSVGVNNSFSSDSPTNWFNGVIDEPAVYNSVLSASRISAHYTAGTVNPSVFVSSPPSTTLGVTISNTATTPSIGDGDRFLDRIALVDEYGVYSGIDLSTASLEASEPNPNGATKTWWFEYLQLVDHPETLRVRAFGGSGTVKIAVFRTTDATIDPSEGDDPSFASLTLVASGAAGDVTWTTTDDDGSYYIQVGLTAGTGTGWSLEYTFADPGDGGTFDTAIDIDGMYGASSLDAWNGVLETGEPTPVAGAIRSGWFRWTCPTPAPSGAMTITSNYSEASGNHGVAVYTGSAVNALTLVQSSGSVTAGNPALVQFTPAAGTTYYFYVGTTLDRGIFEITWVGPANLAAPAQVFQYVRVEVYDSTGTTKITEIKNRFGVEGRDSLNTPGTGQFSIHAKDELLAAYPNLLNHRNIVKFWLGSTCFLGFRIQQVETTLVSNSEVSGFIKTVSGPTVHYLMDDFIIKHFRGKPRPGTMYDDRNYTWASAYGAWFTPSRWTDRYNINSLTNPPGGRKGLPARKRPKYGFPKRWRDRYAKWMWLSTHPGLNQGGYRSPRPIRGLHYYRKNVSIARNGTPVRIYASADAHLHVYLDGDLVISRAGTEKGYKTFVFYDAILDKGIHTIAILMQSLKNTNAGDRNEAVLFSMARMNNKGRPAQWLLRSGKGWYCYHGYGVQTWNKAKILLDMVAEAKTRGNGSALALGYGFTGTTDSEGLPWADQTSRSIRIGTSVLSAQAQLSEDQNFDVWVDPSNMQIKAYRNRGTDKSKSVALTPGLNLLDWKVTDTDDVKNDVLVRYEKGYTSVRNASSVSTYGVREGYMELGGINDPTTARNVADGALKGVIASVLRAGSPEVMYRNEFLGDGGIVGIEGAYPFLDFNIGDIISAPNKDGVLARHRVLGLGFSENNDGYLTFDPELEVM